jgi:tetratricopeptide (TPR) repeat protein
MIKLKFIKTATGLNLLIYLFLFVPSLVEAQSESTFTQAVALFQSKEYGQALPIFKNLLAKDSADAMLNYYYGTSLVETGIFTDETSNSLLKALTGNTPDKIYFYLGKYYETKKEWNSALKYYNRFKNFGSDQEKTEVGILERIDYCYAQANQIEITKPDTLFKIQPETNKEVYIAFPEPNLTDTIPVQIEVATKSPPVEPSQKAKPQFSFQINSEIEYLIPEHFKNAEALEAFNQGSQAEARLKEIIAESDSLRNVYEKSVADREGIAQKILSNEQESIELKSRLESLFAQARNLEQEYWKNAGEVDARKFRFEVEELKKKEEPIPEVEVVPVEILTLVDTDNADIEVQPEPETKPSVTKPVDDIVFKIQLGTYKVLPPASKKMLEKLAMLREVDHFKDEKGMTIYTTGNLTNFEDAIKMQNQVRQEGVKDAFVAAYRNGKRININEAKELIKKK